MNLGLKVEPIMYKGNMGYPLPLFSVSDWQGQALTMSVNHSCMLADGGLCLL